VNDPGWDEPVAGNEDCVAMLENCLAHARTGKVNFAAVIMCQPPNHKAAVFAGIAEMELVAREAIENLTSDIDKAVHDRTVPPADPALGADHVTYNIASGPLAYDFISWLIDQEMIRVREGAPPPLKVAFWKSHDGSEPLALQNVAGRRMFANVIRPAIELIGAVEEPYCGGRYRREHLIADIIKASRRGEQVPRLKINLIPRLDPGYVTITLREARHWPTRNSHVHEWLKFAAYLKKRGERVIFVRDTAMANEPITGETTFPIASVDLRARMGLYQQAKCNCFVGNGPSSLAMFSDQPFIIFNEVYADDHPYYPATGHFLRAMLDLDPDEDQQFPWCRADQRVVWEPDTYDNMVAAWERWMRLQPTMEAAE
jgi:hypothetical protein